MKRILLSAVAVLALVVGLAPAARAQTVIKNTTLSNNINTGQQNITVGSITTVTVGQFLYVADQNGELMQITAVPSSGTTLTVRRNVRGSSGTASGNPVSHASGALVFIGDGAAFVSTDPNMPCTRSLTSYQPIINTTNGNMWVCPGGTATSPTTWIGANIRKLTYNCNLLGNQ